MNNLTKKLALKASSIFASVLLLATTAQAALPSWASTAGTDLGDNVSDFENLVGPIILAVAVAILGIKLFKRFTSKI